MKHRTFTVAVALGGSLLLASFAAARVDATTATDASAADASTELATNAAALDAEAQLAPKGPAPAKGRGASGKLTISALEGDFAPVTAQYNPKEIGVDKSVPWQKSASSTSDQPEMTFTKAEGRTMTFDLTFDTADARQDVHATYVAPLLSLAMIMQPAGPEDSRRPPRVVVSNLGALRFEGVIESIGTKYTMFLDDGTPVRATCSVKIREASRASFKRPK